MFEGKLQQKHTKMEVQIEKGLQLKETIQKVEENINETTISILREMRHETGTECYSLKKNCRGAWVAQLSI